MSRFEPVTVDVKEAMIGPVARRDEEDEEENRAVDTRSVQEIGEKKEGNDESSFPLLTLICLKRR